MPIETKQLFKCTKCNFKTYRMVGDVRPSPVALKPCPKCESMMNIIPQNDISILDRFEATIGKISDEI